MLTLFYNWPNLLIEPSMKWVPTKSWNITQIYLKKSIWERQTKDTCRLCSLVGDSGLFAHHLLQASSSWLWMSSHAYACPSSLCSHQWCFLLPILYQRCPQKTSQTCKTRTINYWSRMLCFFRCGSRSSLKWQSMTIRRVANVPPNFPKCWAGDLGPVCAAFRVLPKPAVHGPHPELCSLGGMLLVATLVFLEKGKTSKSTALWTVCFVLLPGARQTDVDGGCHAAMLILPCWRK